MALQEKQCVPCQGGIAPLSEAEAAELLTQTPGWELKENARKLYRRYEFKNFAQALASVNIIGEVAEKEFHHPDIEFGWGYCGVTIQTHKINGLHENDFILAAKITAALNKAT